MAVVEALGGMHRVTIQRLKQLGSALGQADRAGRVCSRKSPLPEVLLAPDEGECSHVGDSST